MTSSNLTIEPGSATETLHPIQRLTILYLGTCTRFDGGTIGLIISTGTVRLAIAQLHIADVHSSISAPNLVVSPTAVDGGWESSWGRSSWGCWCRNWEVDRPHATDRHALHMLTTLDGLLISLPWYYRYVITLAHLLPHWLYVQFKRINLSYWIKYKIRLKIQVFWDAVLCWLVNW